MSKPSAPSPPPSSPPSPPPPAVVATATPTTVAHATKPQRGDVYWVNIPKSHTKGHEQFKRRPFLVVSNNAIHHLDLVIGVPLSFQILKKNRQYHIQVLATDIVMDPGSTLDPGNRIALTEQVRCLSVERLESDRQARVSDTAVYAVESGLAFVMDIR
jgi:mRNA-degrading endonuclease toxin of MazEF toxin-antitoxin module